jgi:cysteine desulfurase
MKDVYLDHGSATPLDPKVLKSMERYLGKDFGNPNSFHSCGLQAQKAVEDSRSTVAKILKCSPHDVIFTGCGTESCNLAIKGTAFAYRSRNKNGGHIITSAIEHHAVLDACRWLETQCFDVTVVGVDKYGLVNPEDIRKAIRKDTFLISIMYANNEIGTVQSIKEIGKLAWSKGVLFHSDACQAGLLELDVEKLRVDLLTLNGSKIYGPKGVGMLFKRKGVKLEPLLHGGGQEQGLRSGTLNVAGIVGFAKALELIQKSSKDEANRLSSLRDRLISGVLKKIPRSYLNGHATKRLPKNANFTFLDVEGESMVLQLDAEGIQCSTGSACTSKNLEPSYVITAIGVSKKAAHGTLRFTLGKKTRKKDIDNVLKFLPRIVSDLRRMSPVRLKGLR